MLHPQDVAVILLNYNGAKDTITCLHALYTLFRPPGSIIVVDNASPDDSVQHILSAWKQWETPFFVNQKTRYVVTLPAKALLLSLSQNNGYASGNNAGIRIAQKVTACTAYWLLNNDTEPTPYALDALCERYNNQEKKSVLVGSTLVFSFAPSRVQCAAGNSIIGPLGLTRALCGGQSIHDVLSYPTSHVEKRLGQISGASLLLTEPVIERIGVMREDFFLYLEDTDFSMRASKAGIPLLWARESIVLHKEGGTTGAASVNNRSFQRPQWIDYLMLRNRARLVLDYYPFALPLLCTSYLVVFCRRLLRRQLDRTFLVFRALGHALVGKMGKPDWL